MATPAAEQRIKNARNSANRVWKSEVDHYTREEQRLLGEAAKTAISSTAQANYRKQADYARECADYCRARMLPT